MKTKIIRFYHTGGPEVLTYEETELLPPGDSEVQVRHKAIGINYIESYYRSGLYPVPLPSGLGTEASGIVVSVGKKVTRLRVGDRVAYAHGPLGSYAEKRNIPEEFLVKLPEEVSFVDAASLLLKGLTVRYLFKDISELKTGDTILFHAAAGGVGLIACQWAKHLGVKLIGTTSSEEKGLIAKDMGAWQMINYSRESIPEKVLELTRGEKVPVIFDSVGKATWKSSLESLQRRGLIVSFGNASGPVTDVALAELQRGSFFVTRPILAHYVDTPDKLQVAAEDLFSLIQTGIIRAHNVKTLSFLDAVRAHQELAGRDRVGGLVLLCD